MTTQPEALRLADALADYTGCTLAQMDQAAAELRRLHAENERLTNLCYDYTGQITALRAAEQMRTRIDAMKERNT
jgi:outer membrane murein-binding lipoprotein Lpp